MGRRLVTVWKSTEDLSKKRQRPGAPVRVPGTATTPCVGRVSGQVGVGSFAEEEQWLQMCSGCRLLAVRKLEAG